MTDPQTPLLPASAVDALPPALDKSPVSPMHDVAEELATPQKNTLPRRDQRRLENWVVDRWPEIVRRAVTQKTVAEEATGDPLLNLTVTRGNLIAAVRAIGRTWPNTPRAALVGRLARQLRQTETIALRLAELLADLGRPVPDDVAAIARGDDPTPTPVDPPPEAAGLAAP